MSKRTLGAVAALAGLLVAAAPAHAGTLVGNPGKGSTPIESPGAFSGDAYDNEMGVRAAWILPEVDDEVL